MRKILICCFTLLLLFSYILGQDKYDPRSHSKDPAVRGAFLKVQTEDVKNNAEFVFEGFTQRHDIYPRKDKSGEVYYVTSGIVKITKVFRGNLKPGTVEVTGIQELNGFIPPSERESYILSDSTKYIFFSRAAGKDHPYDATYDIYPVDNKTILTSYNKYVKCGFRIPDDYMFETPMHTKGDVYRYIRKLPNVKMPKLTEEDTVEVYHKGKAISSESRRLTQVEKDSLMDIIFAKRRSVLHRADSIGRIKVDSIGRIKSDSIEFVKKKVKPLTSLKTPVAT